MSLPRKGRARRWRRTTYDVRDRAAVVPLLVAGGSLDVVVPADQVDAALDGVGHLPPAEAPAATAALITDFLEDRG